MQKGMPSRAGGRVTPRAQGPDEGGFTLVEVIVAVVILMVVVISFSYLLVDSLSTALLSKQREAAASLASDVVENARAIGLTSLINGGTTCSLPSTVLTGPPIITAGCFDAGYSASVKIDTTTYAISTAPLTTTSTPISVTVQVTWTQASKGFVYTSTSQVGV